MKDESKVSQKHSSPSRDIIKVGLFRVDAHSIWGLTSHPDLKPSAHESTEYSECYHKCVKCTWTSAELFQSFPISRTTADQSLEYLKDCRFYRSWGQNGHKSQKLVEKRLIVTVFWGNPFSSSTIVCFRVDSHAGDFYHLLGNSL